MARTQSDTVIERYSHRREPASGEGPAEKPGSKTALQPDSMHVTHERQGKAKSWPLKIIKKALITAIRLAAALAFITFAMHVISTRG